MFYIFRYTINIIYLMKHSLFLITLLFSFYSCLAQDTAAIRLNAYGNKISAIIDKSELQYNEVNNAIKTKNINGMEAARQSLLHSVSNGLQQLRAIENFDDDASLKYTAGEVLKFYKKLAESDIPQVREFFIVEANYSLVQKEFEKKPRRKHSQKEIDLYNSETKKYSDALARYNQLSGFIASGRKTTLYNWNGSKKIFMESHKK